MRLLLIGALPPPIGGTTVLFKQLIDDLRARSVPLSLIDVSRTNTGPLGNLFHGLKCLLALAWHLPRATVVSLHVSSNGAAKFGPVVHALARLCGRRWMCRIFGGDLDDWYQRATQGRRRVFDATVLRADAVLLERRSSVRYFSDRTTRPVVWYPNNRRVPQGLDARSCSGGARRFVFVSHVKPDKGIRELIEAAQECAGDGIVVDVYGPMQDGVTEEWFVGSAVNYRGVLAAADVASTLRNYDVLLLPTYWAGEGYPGVILEAYGAGLAVIATRWGGIPEIVTSQSGLLVDPRDARQLCDAMRSLIDSDEQLRSLQEGARRSALEFDAGRWTEQFVALCSLLART